MGSKVRWIKQHVQDKRVNAGHTLGGGGGTAGRSVTASCPVLWMMVTEVEPLDLSERKIKRSSGCKSDLSVWQLCTQGNRGDFITHQSEMWRLPEAAVVWWNVPACGDRVSRMCGKCFKPCPLGWDVLIQALESDRLINKENVKGWTYWLLKPLQDAL